MDLSEPLALIETLSSRLELTDADIGDLGGRIGALSNDVSALSNSLVGLEGDVRALSNDVGALSKCLVGQEGDVRALSLNFNDVDLNVSGVARIGGSNILDLIDKAMSEPYVLPNDISLSNLTVEKIKGIGFPEYLYVQGSLYPDGILHQIGNPVQQ